MTRTKILSLPIQANPRTIALFIVAIALPNLLGLVNIPTHLGFNVHFFQLAIFLAAAIYGPIGGAASGLVGSIYSAAAMGNPFIIVGNVILGFFYGLFTRLRIHPVLAVILAFAIQIPWLVATDFYLVHMPSTVVRMLLVSLALSNVLWAVVAGYLARPLAKVIDARA
jgi:uncharacterized membrane protein